MKKELKSQKDQEKEELKLLAKDLKGLKKISGEDDKSDVMSSYSMKQVDLKSKI